MACGEAPRLAILTLILYDIIPNSVRSARGRRSHEASCGWDRMRRPRPGEDVSPAPGRRRELRPAATMSRPPGAWLSGADRPPCASPKTRSQGGSNGRFSQSAARRSKEDAAMARHEAPASLERERATERTMVAPPGAPSPSRLRGTKETTAYPAPEKMRAKMLAHAV
jgi:hypothetical protein